MHDVCQHDLFAAPPDNDNGVETKPLRPYQVQAHAAILRDLAEVRATLLTLATGLGKTRTFGAVARTFADQGLRTLVIAHSIVLVDQAAAAMRELGLSVEVERSDSFATRNGGAQVVVATVQTLGGKRLRGWAPDAFGLVVIDEAHRALSSQHMGVVNYFARSNVLGVTATSDRQDGKALGNLFERVSFEMDILEGIRGGYLAPLEFRTIATGWDPKRCKEVAGEVSAGSVEKELIRAGVLGAAADTMAELGADKKVLAFLPTVAAANAFGVELRARGIAAASISGGTPAVQRANIFRDFKSGAVKVLCNVAVLIEGFDAPDVNVVALLAPTKSRARLVQCVGRATRLSPGKTHATILDFCPGRLRKGRLASPADALAGKMLDDDVIAAMPSDGNLMDAVVTAQKTAADMAEQRERAEQRDRERRERLEQMRALAKPSKAKFGQHAHEADDLMSDDGGPSKPVPNMSAFYAGTGPTRSQVAAMPDEERKAAGFASSKQSAILRRNGFNGEVSRALAGRVIDTLVQNGWKMPADVKASMLSKHRQLSPTFGMEAAPVSKAA